jgi:SAM-dependent methyltransferase
MLPIRRYVLPSEPRKSIYEWAVEYCGDPASHSLRGLMIRDFLIEQGMTADSRVLDIGCGALSQGAALISYLNEGNYVGLDPNGWLIEACLQADPQLEEKNPSFHYGSEFKIKGEEPFDFVVAHSVLSHAAQWQLEQALMNVRKLVRPGAVWLASLRLSEEDLFSRTWMYPDVSFFRLETVKTVGWHAGWHVQRMDELRERLIRLCPNDFHDWVRLYAVEIPEEINELRLDDERVRAEAEGLLDAAHTLYRQREKQRQIALREEAEANGD